MQHCCECWGTEASLGVIPGHGWQIKVTRGWRAPPAPGSDAGSPQRIASGLLRMSDIGVREERLCALRKGPGMFARWSSESPYSPAALRFVSWIREKRFGRIIEARAGFHHSSGRVVTEPINRKRMVEFIGEYGCMQDLGIRTQHIPSRMGRIPRSVHAVLSKIGSEWPDGNESPEDKSLAASPNRTRSPTFANAPRYGMNGRSSCGGS
jgi:hypothetical protein